MAAQIANLEQAASWDGDTGHHWATHDARYLAAARRHSDRLFERAAIAAGERVIDIGCGSGSTTCEAAAKAAPAAVLGLDLSAELLELARRRAAAAGLENVRFEQADAQIHPLEGGTFEVAISRFGGMFFGDPVAAYRNIGTALVDGGRLALLSWGPLERNEWVREARRVLAAGASLPALQSGAPGMFGLAERERIETILEDAGFIEIEVTALAEPVELGPDASAATAFISGTGFARGILEQQPLQQREQILAALREMLAGYERDEGVLVGSEALLTSARRDG